MKERINPPAETARGIRDGITRMSAILCLSVVLLHLNNTPLTGLAMSHPGYMAAFAVNKFLSFAVPAFLFLSGYKLFARYETMPLPIGRFYLGRLKKILLPYLGAVAIYFLYFHIKGWVSLSDLPEYVFLGTLAAHFYYVVIAAQLYLIFPLLRRAIVRKPYLTLGLSLLCTLVLQQTQPFPYADRFFGSYLFYFVLGAVFARRCFTERAVSALKWTVIPAAVIGVLHAWLSYRQVCGALDYILHGTVNLVYATLATVSLFRICQGSPRPARLLSTVASGSYGIYLYHLLTIFALQYDVLPYLEVSVGVRFLILAVGVSAGILIYICLKERLCRRKAGEED